MTSPDSFLGLNPDFDRAVRNDEDLSSWRIVDGRPVRLRADAADGERVDAADRMIERNAKAWRR